MKKRLVLVILVAVLSAVLLAACTGDKTTDATPDATSTPTSTPTAEPTATPDPLLTMDEAERADYIYNKAMSASMEYSSIKIAIDFSWVTRVSDTDVIIRAKGESVSMNNGTDSFVEKYRMDMTDEYNGITYFNESGYGNGYAYEYTDTHKRYARMSADEYVGNKESEESELGQLFEPEVAKSETKKSLQQDDGTWLVVFKDYSKDNNDKLFEILFDNIAGSYKDIIEKTEIEIQFVVDSDFNVVAFNTYLVAETVPEYDMKLDIDMLMKIVEINTVQEVELPDFSDFTLVDDLYCLEKVASAISNNAKNKEGQYQIKTMVKLDKDLYYRLEEIVNGTFGYKNDLFTFNVSVDCSEDYGNGNKQTANITYTYDGAKYKATSTLEGEYETFLGEDTAWSFIESELKCIEFDESAVKDYTVNVKNGLKTVEMELTEDASEIVIEWLYYLTELTWDIASYKGTLIAILDAEDNLIQIEANHVASAKYTTYEVTVEIKDVLKVQGF